MSLKTLLKRLFTVADANINSMLDKLDGAEKNLKLASRKLSEEIRRLETARITNEREVIRLDKMAGGFLADADSREAELKRIIKAGDTPSKATALIVLQRRKMAKAVSDRSAELKASATNLNAAIIQLGDRFEEVCANIELVRIQRETNDMGLTLPEDINFEIGVVNVDVDAIIRDIKVSDPQAMVNAPSSSEAEEYLNSLKG